MTVAHREEGQVQPDGLAGQERVLQPPRAGLQGRAPGRRARATSATGATGSRRVASRSGTRRTGTLHLAPTRCSRATMKSAPRPRVKRNRNQRIQLAQKRSGPAASVGCRARPGRRAPRRPRAGWRCSWSGSSGGHLQILVLGVLGALEGAHVVDHRPALGPRSGRPRRRAWRSSRSRWPGRSCRPGSRGTAGACRLAGLAP